MHVYPLANPFLALRPFTREEAARFYGRDADLVLIQSRLYSSRTTLLFAGSGVGKTSLIDARLWPVLERQWRVVPHRQWAARPPLDALCACFTCARHGRGYLRHLFLVGETLGGTLLTIHNLAFMADLARETRAAVESGSFASFRATTLSRLSGGDAAGGDADAA